MKKAIVLVLAALALPGVALAAKPASPGKSAPKVQYVLRGSLSAYTPYNSVGPVMGSITIMIKSSNYHAKALKGQSLTFVVDAKTKVNVKTIKDGDKGIVKIRALKRIPAANLAATLQAAPARPVIDQAPSS
jgi:hypothetical protein